MKTIELFSGTKSFSKVACALGHSTYTIDANPELRPDLTANILTLDKVADGFDVLWASPPCEGFSVAAIGKNWNHDKTPKHPRAELAMNLVLKTIEIIKNSNPRFWFIENPRGMLRKMPFMELSYLGGGPAYCYVLSIW